MKKEKPDFKKISIYETPKQSPGFLLWHISTSWRSHIETAIREFGLTHPQFVIMAAIGWLTRHEESVTQIMIGKMGGLDPNTTSQIIKGLEQKNLIQRKASTDARAKNVSLTAKGTEILGKALPAVENADAKFFQILTQDEQSSLLALFQKLCQPS